MWGRGMGRVLLVAGGPGAGKSWVMARLLKQLGPGKPVLLASEARGSLIGTKLARCTVLGSYAGGAFDGTDRLSFSVQPVAAAWVKGFRGTVIFEGNRLTNAKFLQHVLSCGHQVTALHLTPPVAVTRKRREQRAHKLGKPLQSGSWVRAAEARVERALACLPHHAVHRVSSSTACLEKLLAQLA